MKVDLAIIGGGGAGFAAAAKANELGIHAVLINRGLPLGGTCVNVGCVPSKFLLEAGFDRFRAAHPRFKSIASVTSASDFSSIIEEKDQVVLRNRKAKYKDVLPQYKTVKLLEERARFETPNKIKAGDQIIEAKYTLICTGSSNKKIPLPGLASLHPESVLDNISAFRLRELPKSMLILGGGPTGLEMAQIFSHLGTKVTVIEANDRAFSISEPEISAVLEKNFIDEGINVLTGARALRVSNSGGEISLVANVGGEEQDLRAEKLFLAVGVQGNTHDLNLEAIGLTTDKNGFIDVDERMRTKVPNVFAAGDVAGPPWLETLSAREGAIAVESALNGSKMSIDYDIVPFAIFIEPQVAMVGLTEEELMRRIGVCECRTVELKFLTKADITNQTNGVAKIVRDPNTNRLRGFHLVSPHAAEIIHEAAVAIQMKATIDDLINLVHVFPTFSEIVKLSAQAFKRDIKTMSCCVE